ncbi:MAG: oligosaccharide biosynthesis protein Alg14 [Thiothrix sp.]|nr:oligosaccharide biosynthesis protein Alg14 [Thiothrix sp.]HPQ95406.1 oligosaccharide biosynthesis protein Alg14 [Thiolinea sp.]
MSRKARLFAISSPGGHWIQLTRLCAGLEQRYDIVYAMPDRHFQSRQSQKVYAVTDVSADDKWRLIPCALQVLWILLKERPQAILSTGAAPGVVAILLGRLLGIRTIWVDSIANVQKISRSGELVRHRADVFLTQWEHLSDGGQVQYQGSVL